MTRLPPGYDQVAADGDLAGVLGVLGHGFLLALMRMAEPVAHPPGAWVVALPREDIAGRAGIGRNKAVDLLGLFERAGLIVTEPGRRLGQGFGSTPPRRFLALPGMTLPDGGQPVRPPGIRPPQTRAFQLVPPYSGRSNSTPVKGQASSSTPDQVDVNEMMMTHQSDQPSDTRRNSSTNPMVTRALADIGWVGAAPATDAPDDVIIALAGWLRNRGGISSKGAYLRRILSTPGEAVRLAAELGLATPLGSTDAYADAVTRMSHEEYVQRCIADPDWEQQVMRAARARAADEGVKYSMALVREVAAELAS